MSAKASVPSLWAETAPPAPDCPPLEGTHETEVAIIGGGFTGLSAALHLAQEGRAVHVLEAAEPGWGASGRNGGQVNPAWKVLPDDIEARHGRAAGARIVAMASATCDLVFDLIERHQIGCDAVRPGYVQGGFAAPGKRHLDKWVRQWSKRGAPVAFLERAEAEALLGTDAYDCAMLDRRGGNIQPLSFARGLAQAAMEKGAAVHGASTVSKLRRAGAAWRVETAQGAVTAEKVFLCTNGYSDALWPGLRQSVVPAPSFVAATEPLDDTLRAQILPGKHAVSETRRNQFYYCMDRHGRFVIGGRGNLLDSAEQGDTSHIQAAASKLFPQLRDARWAFAWGGYVAMTWNKAPKLMRLDDNVYAGLGYNGRGVAMATMMGKQLALLALGETPDMPVSGLKRIPFHAFRRVGITTRLIGGALLDRLEGVK